MISYIDIPKKREKSDYSECVDYLVKKIGADENVTAIFSFGNVTTPGISDIDMLVVFREGVNAYLQPFDKFPARFNGLFTHGVDAVSDSRLVKLKQYSFLENMNLIYGADNSPRSTIELTAGENSLLRFQAAMEFLITNYVDLVLQLEYGIVKLRAFLQHTKGLLYDLRLLNVSSGELFQMVTELREKIRQWWSAEFSPAEFSVWIMQFYHVYEQFIKSVFQSHSFYLPEMQKYKFLQNVTIENASTVSWRRSGITLPNSFSFLGRKYFNLQRRLNEFFFQIPLINKNIPDVIQSRHSFFENMKAYNQEHFPFFDSFTTGFKLKEK
jgi:hypothetical protein